MSNKEKWTLVFLGLGIGNLATSICFYSAFDNWKPMVWSAGINSGVFIFLKIFNVLNEY